MHEIQIFIASSTEEFEKERKELMQFFMELNNEYTVKKGIYFKPVICENMSKAMSDRRKQDEYNEQIQISKYFYLLVGDRLGIYTHEEFDVAWKKFQETHEYPLIYTYFRKTDDESKVDENVKEFIQYLNNQLKHFHTEYTSFDSIKLDILLELTRNLDLSGAVRFEGGEATIEGKEFMSLENIPIYQNNNELQSARQRLIEINEEYAVKRAKSKADPDDEDLMECVSDLNHKKNELAAKIREMEMAVLESCNLLSKRSSSPNELDGREQKAIEFIRRGEFEEANILLRDNNWKKEIDDKKQILYNLRDQVRKYISGKRTLISNLKATGMSDRKAKEILAIYDEIYHLVLEWEIEADVLYEYTEFLFKQKDYKFGIQVSDKMLHLLEITNSVPTDTIARLHNVRGNLYREDRDYEKAEKEFLLALKLFEELSEENNNSGKIASATICNDISELYWKQNRIDEQLKYLAKGRSIFEEISALQNGSDSYIISGMAVNYRRTATGYRKINDFGQTLYNFQKALAIYEELLGKDFEEYAIDHSMTKNDFAYLLNELNRHKDSEAMYREAVEIRRRLVAINKSAYVSNLAATISNLAVVLRIEKKYKESQALAEESISIREKLVEKDRSAFISGLAFSYRNYANTLMRIGKFEEAEKFFQKAIEIRRSQAEKDPQAYNFDYANVLKDYASLLYLKGELDLSERMFEDSVSVFKRLIEDNIRKETDTSLLADIGLAIVLRKKKQIAKAEEILRAAYKNYFPLYKQDEYTLEYLAPAMAILYNEMAQLLMMSDDNDEALKEAYKHCLESLEIYDGLVNQQPEVYTEDLIHTLNVFLEIARRMGNETIEIENRLNALVAAAVHTDDDNYFPDLSY